MSPTMTIKKIKLKIRIGSYVIGSNSGVKPCELNQPRDLSSISNKPDEGKPHKTVIHSIDTLDVKNSAAGSKKRGLSELGDGPKEKRRKMDRSVTQQCAIEEKQNGGCKIVLQRENLNGIVKRIDNSCKSGTKIPTSSVKCAAEAKWIGGRKIVEQREKLNGIVKRIDNSCKSGAKIPTSGVRCAAEAKWNGGRKIEQQREKLNGIVKRIDNSCKSGAKIPTSGVRCAAEAKWNGGRKIVQQRENLNGIVKRIDNSCKSGNLNGTVKSIDNSCKRGTKIPTSGVRCEPKRLISAVKKKSLRKRLLELVRGKVPSATGSKKRGLSELGDGRKEKRRKMDHSVTQQCAIEAKWNGGRKIEQPREKLNGIVKRIDNSCKSGTKIPTSGVRCEPKRLISAVEKQNLKKQLLELVRGKVPTELQGFLKKSGFDLQRVDRVEEIVGALGDDDLLELKNMIRRSWVVPSAKVPAKKPDHVCQQSQVKITHKGTDNGIRSASVSVNAVPSTTSVTSICGLCHSLKCKCKCKKQSYIAHTSTDISLDVSRDHLEVAMRDCGMKLNADPLSGKSEIEFKGPDSPIDVQLSLQKALRAALLKSRFAETILKAKEKSQLVDKVDPVKFQQEKKRLERQQQEERTRIEAQIKTSEEIVRIRAEAARKFQRQREREREAARLALQQMVKTVEIDNDHIKLKDLMLLSGCSRFDQYSCSSYESSPEVGSGKSGCFSRPLERLGLFVKDDYCDYMED